VFFLFWDVSFSSCISFYPLHWGVCAPCWEVFVEAAYERKNESEREGEEAGWEERKERERERAPRRGEIQNSPFIPFRPDFRSELSNDGITRYHPLLFLTTRVPAGLSAPPMVKETLE
jgi:hypothetical protein